MIRMSIARLEADRAARPAGYVDALLAKEQKDGFVLIKPEDFNAIREAYFGKPNIRGLECIGMDGAKCAIVVPAKAAAPVPDKSDSPKDYPSVGKMGLNLLGAATRMIVAAAKGEPVILPKEEQEKRLAICTRPCEFYDPQEGRCSQCGCKMKGLLLAKIRHATEDCPKGYWPKVDGGGIMNGRSDQARD